MNREEAMVVLKDILLRCSGASIEQVMIMSDSNNSKLSNDNQLYVVGNFDNDFKSNLQAIAQEHNMAIKEEDNKVIIYKPSQQLLIAN